MEEKNDILRNELKGGEVSPMIENFDSQIFLDHIHEQSL
jgi:hypothetical protein